MPFCSDIIHRRRRRRAWLAWSTLKCQSGERSASAFSQARQVKFLTRLLSEKS